jgi:hypothetical protein
MVSIVDGMVPTQTWSDLAWRDLALLPDMTSHDMASRDRIVLFGGCDPGCQGNDTWKFDGADWTEVYPAPSPGARYGGAIDYDSGRSLAVLFGGFGPVAGGGTCGGTSPCFLQ